jgi:hypothetical protein
LTHFFEQSRDGKTTSLNFDGTTTRPSSITESGTWDGKFITLPAGTNRNDWVTTKTDNVWQGVNGTNNPCPSGYRVPSLAELDAELDSWTQSPISSNNDRSGALASPLKLPSAGRRDRVLGTHAYVGSIGFYWSSTVSGDDAMILSFAGSNASTTTDNRAFGYSVRCIKH